MSEDKDKAFLEIDIDQNEDEVAEVVELQLDLATLDEAEGEIVEVSEPQDNLEAVEGTELSDFESAEIEELEFIEEEQAISIVESLLFSTDRPLSLAAFKNVFKGTTIKLPQIRKTLEALQIEYASGRRGVTLEEINGGYQLRTKLDNMEYMKRQVKARPFRLSGPALEVLAIVAYQQPCPKAAVDDVRGVESGHLLRALMEKNLVHFEGRSDLPGKPMLYSTTRRFLEIFGLRNLRELPSLSEIDDLMPEGIGEEQEKPKLSDMTESLSQSVDSTYSQGEEELLKISSELEQIATTSDFFEQEKERQRRARDEAKAQDIRERQMVGEVVESRELKWLERYEAAQAVAAAGEGAFVAEVAVEGEGVVAAAVEATEEPLTPMAERPDPSPDRPLDL